MVSERALVLAIETSNPTSEPGRSASVALARAGADGAVEALAAVALGEGERQGLMPSIDACFQRAGLAPEALRAPGSRVAVSIGPGGYTSIRIAVTAAKMIAAGTGAACVGVETARVVAASVKSDVPFAVAIASKRETTWVTVFEPSGDMRRTPGLVDEHVLRELAAEGVGLLVVDRFGPPRMVEGARGLGMRIEAPVFDALACAALGMKGNPVDPVEIAPLYPREPEAVTKWRALKGS